MEKASRKPMVYRHERKYLVENVRFAEMRMAILTHPAGFLPLFQPRYINNIYLDTLGFDFYYDNVDGEWFRTKYRVRWYGDLYQHIEKPVLEIKAKKGLVGTKYAFRLKPFCLDASFNAERWAEIIRSSDFPDDARGAVAGLKPVLLNRYLRSYFISLDKKFRVTIDSQMSYFPFSGNNPASRDHALHDNTIVVELKYAPEDDQEAREISAAFPFLLTKSSKYLHGIERLMV